MDWRHWSIAAVFAVAVPLLAGVIWLLSLPPAVQALVAPPIPSEESEATLAALKPPKRPRPVIAIIGLNDATEATDYLMPFGILRRADVADVRALSTEPGPIVLYPALKVMPQATIDEFDREQPDGADYIIVPAMSRADPAALAWIRSQARKGSIVIGICVGAIIVAEAALLDGKRGTTHWYSLDALQQNHPVHYIADRRLVADKGVATTTGITASMPAMLTLIEAIAGREKAIAVARDLGLTDWDLRHRSAAFALTRPFALTALSNALQIWNHYDIGIELKPGLDEISLALAADAWSRTFRSQAITFATVPAVKTRGGLHIIADEKVRLSEELVVPAEILAAAPAQTLDETLAEIEARLGRATADLVSMQLEYPRLNHANEADGAKLR